jgi:hypothetical protein
MSDTRNAMTQKKAAGLNTKNGPTMEQVLVDQK